jgi:FkbM family methyltransferase
MPALTGLLKPCYVFAPQVLMRRLGRTLARTEPSQARVRLPWGTVIEVNVGETIGRELYMQNVFDIAVSEAAWRILRPGDLAIDVGANVGYMTSLFAARVGTQGRVESFEPHPRIFARLQRNVQRMRGGGAAARITLYDCALGNRDGVARLVEPGSFGLNEGTCTVTADASAPSLSGSAPGIEIRIRSLDSITLDQRIALLKVDVEGFEAEVFAGASRLLATQRVDNIVYEAHDRERSALHALLAGYGYSIFGIGHNLFGLKISAGPGAPAIDGSWESPSYLATLQADAVIPALRHRGWQVLANAA